MRPVPEVDERIRASLGEVARHFEPTRSGADALPEIRARAERLSVRRRLERRVLAVAAVAAVAAGVVALRPIWQGGDDVSDVQMQDSAGDPTTSGPPPTPSSTTSTTAATTTTTTTPPETTVADDPPPGDTGRPGADNTGPTAPDALVPATAAEIEAMMRPGAVIENVAITGGDIDVLADDVTIRNVRLDAEGARFGFRSCGADGDCGTTEDQHTGFVVEDAEIVDTASSAFWGRSATFRRVEVHDSGDAFTPLADVVIEASWWHHLGSTDNESANGVQFLGGAANIRITGNHCDMPVTVEAPYRSSSCLIVSVDETLSAVVEGNWFNGGNYSLHCNDQQEVVVRDNRFGRDHRFGPLTGCPNATGNVWDDTGEQI